MNIQPLLDAIAPLILPDWGALINLLPFLVAILFIGYFAWTLRRFATAGPTRRAPARAAPIAPSDVHMPGGSIAPIVVAFGAGALFLGLVAGGIWLGVAVVVLILALLVWGREALREYDHLEPATTLPAVVHEGPPPGVHMPGPSIRPLLGALGATALFAGLVAGGWVLVLALVFLAWTLIGWLVDATAEYRKVEEADATGHLENIPPRRLPARTLQVFAVLFVLLGLVQIGVLPPQSGTAAGGPGASPGASAGPSLPPGTIVLIAKNIAFDKKDIEAKAGEPFTIQLRNQDDASTPHDVVIRDNAGKTIQDAPQIKGGAEVTHTYQPLPAGTYTFICSVHPIPQMTGTLTVK